MSSLKYLISHKYPNLREWNPTGFHDPPKPFPCHPTLYHTGDKSFSIFSLKQKRPGPEGRVLSQSSGMDFPVAFESPQLTEGCVTLGAHVGLEPRVGA